MSPYFRSVLLCCCLFCGAGFLFSFAAPHSEVVGTIVFERYNSTLYARATFDKRHLALALAEEGKCPAQTMLSQCATQYVEKHIAVSINQEPVALHKEHQGVEQHAVVITYKVGNDVDELNKVDVHSTYMLSYNDHSSLRIISKIDEQPRRYTLDAQRKQISITFE